MVNEGCIFSCTLYGQLPPPDCCYMPSYVYSTQYVLTCSDTVSRSGMFCATATAIDQCKTEGVVDVFQVVKVLRLQKPGAITTVVSFSIILQVYMQY